MLRVDLNCDMGEGFDNDARIMPYISSVNIACGYHAGNTDTMRRTVELALKYGVAIGAHPSYPDKENFGRTDLLGTLINYSDLSTIVTEQVSLLQDICNEFGTSLHHVKPHGALYNRAAKEAAVSAIICSAVQQIEAGLVVYGLSNSVMKKEAVYFNLAFASEAFADRRYMDDGSLAPRTEANALIEDTREAIKQVLNMVKEKKVTGISGKFIPVEADTICIHGDGAHAAEFAKAIHTALQENDIFIESIKKS